MGTRDEARCLGRSVSNVEKSREARFFRPCAEQLPEKIRLKSVTSIQFLNDIGALPGTDSLPFRRLASTWFDACCVGWAFLRS